MGSYIGDYIGSTIGVIKGDTRSLDYSSHGLCAAYGFHFVSVYSFGFRTSHRANR